MAWYSDNPGSQDAPSGGWADYFRKIVAGGRPDLTRGVFDFAPELVEGLRQGAQNNMFGPGSGAIVPLLRAYAGSVASNPIPKVKAERPIPGEGGAHPLDIANQRWVAEEVGKVQEAGRANNGIGTIQHAAGIPFGMVGTALDAEKENTAKREWGEFAGRFVDDPETRRVYEEHGPAAAWDYAAERWLPGRGFALKGLAEMLASPSSYVGLGPAAKAASPLGRMGAGATKGLKGAPGVVREAAGGITENPVARRLDKAIGYLPDSPTSLPLQALRAVPRAAGWALAAPAWAPFAVGAAGVPVVLGEMLLPENQGPIAQLGRLTGQRHDTPWNPDPSKSPGDWTAKPTVLGTMAPPALKLGDEDLQRLGLESRMSASHVREDLEARIKRIYDLGTEQERAAFDRVTEKLRAASTAEEKQRVLQGFTPSEIDAYSTIWDARRKFLQSPANADLVEFLNRWDKENAKGASAHTVNEYLEELRRQYEREKARR